MSERIAGLDRVLPLRRLLRGFDALLLGGILGIPATLIAIIYSLLSGHVSALIFLLIMLTGAMLLAIFSGLLCLGYHKAM